MLIHLSMIVFSVVGFIVAAIVLMLFGAIVCGLRYRSGALKVSEQVQRDLKYANQIHPVECMVRCRVCQTLNPDGAPCAVCDREE